MNVYPNTHRGGTAATARPTTQEESSPMRTQTIDATPGYIYRTYSRWYWFKWRISKPFHPEAVTDAWYAQQCPPNHLFDSSALTLRERVGWAISKWLRECHKRGTTA